MRTSKFAGMLVLALAVLASAEIMRQASAQQVKPVAAERSGAHDVGALHTAALVDRHQGEAEANPQNRPAAGGAGASDPSGDTGPRVALVIGNASFADREAPLVQPVNDARALAKELRGRGFIVELGENLTKQGMQRAIDRFKAKIAPGATALLFYSGYGLHIGREAFLMPVDAEIWRAGDVRRDGLALEPLVAEMNARGATRKLVIVDASRRNLFERRLRGFSSGLAPIAVPADTLVLYGVAPGKAIDDTEGPNGRLVGALLAQLRESGGSAEDIFNRTRVSVARDSNGEQVPGVFSAMVNDFYFASPSPNSLPSKAPDRHTRASREKRPSSGSRQ